MWIQPHKGSVFFNITRYIIEFWKGYCQNIKELILYTYVSLKNVDILYCNYELNWTEFEPGKTVSSRILIIIVLPEKYSWKGSAYGTHELNA